MQPIPSAIISPKSNERNGIKYFCTNSIAMPYKQPTTIILKKILRLLICVFFLCEYAMLQRITNIINKKIWTHLSSHILSCHVILGSFDPGMQSKLVTSKSQMTAKTIDETFFFNADFFRIYV